MKEQVEARTLKEGRYVLIDDQPSKILGIDTSKPGKHGAAKMRIEGVGIFDGSKRSMICAVNDKVFVPMIDKRIAQVISVHGGTAQLMDMESYQTFDMEVPEEFAGQLEAGKEIQYLEAMGKRMITRT
jgi:translation initiation factor 5A